MTTKTSTYDLLFTIGHNWGVDARDAASMVLAADHRPVTRLRAMRALLEAGFSVRPHFDMVDFTVDGEVVPYSAFDAKPLMAVEQAWQRRAARKAAGYPALVVG